MDKEKHEFKIKGYDFFKRTIRASGNKTSSQVNLPKNLAGEEAAIIILTESKKENEEK